MKTAQEMYRFCKENGFGKGMTDKWGIKHFELIEKAMGSDEDAIFCFIGLHNYISATKHDNNYAYAVTNKRILMAQKKVIGENFQTVSLDNINDITMSIGLLIGTVCIDTIKERFNVGVDRATAKKINEELHRALDTAKQHKTSASVNAVATSAADEIMKFKNLLDAGVISQEEFDAKKHQILGL